MDIKEAIMGRRSVRFFIDKAVEQAALTELCEAAIWAPTAGNAQPWHLVAVDDQDLLRKIRTVSPGLLGNPTGLIAVLADKEANVKRMGPQGANLAEMDCCFAAQNVLLLAHAKGLGACVIRSFNQSAVGELLGAPAGVTPELLIIRGHPAKEAPAPKRRTEVIHRNGFEGSAR